MRKPWSISWCHSESHLERKKTLAKPPK